MRTAAAGPTGTMATTNRCGRFFASSVTQSMFGQYAFSLKGLRVNAPRGAKGRCATARAGPAQGSDQSTRAAARIGPGNGPSGVSRAACTITTAGSGPLSATSKARGPCPSQAPSAFQAITTLE